MTEQPDTRARIVDAAQTRFWREGFNATGIASILADAEAGSGSLYHYFASKDDLLVAVLDRYLDQLDPQIVRPATEATSDPIEQVFGILDRYRRGLIATDFRFACPIGRLALELSDPPEPVRALLAENFRRWSVAIEERIVSARDRFPEDVDPSDLARFVLTVMEGAVMQAATAHDLAPFDASVGHLRAYFNFLQENAR